MTGFTKKMFFPYSTIKKTLIIAAILSVGFFTAKNIANSVYAKSVKDIPVQEKQTFNLIKERIQAKQDFNNVFKNGVRLKESNPQLAAAFLTRAVELEPNYRDGWLMLGYVKLKQQLTGEARENLEAALKLDPIHGLTNFLLSKVYAAEGDGEKAQIFLQKANEFGYNDSSE